MSELARPRKDDHHEGDCGDEEITDCGRGAHEDICGDEINSCGWGTNEDNCGDDQSVQNARVTELVGNEALVPRKLQQAKDSIERVENEANEIRQIKMCTNAKVQIQNFKKMCFQKDDKD